MQKVLVIISELKIHSIGAIQSIRPS